MTPALIDIKFLLIQISNKYTARTIEFHPKDAIIIIIFRYWTRRIHESSVEFETSGCPWLIPSCKGTLFVPWNIMSPQPSWHRNWWLMTFSWSLFYVPWRFRNHQQALWAPWANWPINPSVLELWFWVLALCLCFPAKVLYPLAIPTFPPLTYLSHGPWDVEWVRHRFWHARSLEKKKVCFSKVRAVWCGAHLVVHLMEDVGLMKEVRCGLDNGQASLMRVTWPLILEVSKMINLNEFC